MNSLGLKRKLTFEDILDRGEELLFNNIKVYNRAASQYRNGFFYQPPQEDEIADPNHDDRHEKVLAQLKAAADEFQRASEAHRQQARTSFQEAMPGDRGVHQTAAAAAPAPTPAAAAAAADPPAAAAAPAAPPRQSMMASTPQSFDERTQERHLWWKLNGLTSDYQRQQNRLRQDARLKADRQSTLESKRQPQTQTFNISTPAPSPPQSPREVGPSVKMQAKYDERLLSHGNRRQPQMAKPRPEVDRNDERRDKLRAKRQSAQEISRKRPLPLDRSTLRKRKRTENDRGRQRN